LSRLSPPLPSQSTATATPELSPLSLHDALPISLAPSPLARCTGSATAPPVAARTGPPLQVGQRQWRTTRLPHRFPGLAGAVAPRSEEHTSELQSRENLVCRLLLEKKNKESHSRN